MSSTMTLSKRSKPAPPITTASWFFLVNTNMVDRHFSGRIAWHIAVPHGRRYAAGKQEHLHHGSGREPFHDCPGHSFDIQLRFTHWNAGDSFNLVAQRVRRIHKKLTMKLLHLCGGGRAPGHGLLGR